ncbi:MAG: hypothetical protein ACE5JH_05310 [Acidobacteriota bacterium]
MRLAAGFVLLIAGLVAGLWRANLRARPFFDRPTIARRPGFDRLLSSSRWVLILTGLLIQLAAAPAVGAAVIGILAPAWAYHLAIRSVWFQRRLLRRQFDVLRKESPDAPEREILFRLAYSRHPRWGEELIEQMVLDHPSFDEFARIVVLMERGFRGFRPR